MNGGTIVVEGNIGVGKSTCANFLAEAIKARTRHCEVIREPDDKSNPFLADYYADPARNAYKIQIFLMHRRFKDMVYAQDVAARGGWCVLDRSYWGDMCFAFVQRGLGYFTEDEMNAYIEAHKCMARYISIPRAIIHLDADVNKLQQRIAQRNRTCETGISDDYLKALSLEYGKLCLAFSDATRMLHFDWNGDKTSSELRESAERMADLVLADDKANEYKTWIL